MNAVVRDIEMPLTHGSKTSRATVIEGLDSWGRIIHRVGAPDRGVIERAIEVFDCKRTAGQGIVIPDSVSFDSIEDFIRDNSLRVMTVWALNKYENRRTVTRAIEDQQRPAPTPAQLKVLQLVADGFTDEEIGEQLIISPETVRSHVQQLRYRLAARDKVGMVVVGFREGLIT